MSVTGGSHCHFLGRTAGFTSERCSAKQGDDIFVAHDTVNWKIYKATAVLTSSTNAGHLQAIFVIVKDGALLASDPVIQRTCINFSRELLGQWSPGTTMAAAATYYQVRLTSCCQTLIPGIWQKMMEPTFNERDGQ